MSDQNSVIGELIEKGQKTTQNAFSDIAQSTSSQLGIQNEQGVSQNQTQVQKTLEEDQTREMVSDFYAPSDENQQGSQQSLEEQDRAVTEQKLAQVRQELHDQVYYEPLVNYKTERKESKIEEQNQEKMQELMQKEEQKIDAPIAVIRGKTHVETSPGTVG